MTPHRRQSGVALLTVLLLAAAMTVLASAMLDDIRFGLRRSENDRALVQARLYALGSEALASRRILQLQRDELPVSAWHGRPLAFPIEHGQIRARLRDASACFNLNSVVEGAPGYWRRRDLGVRQYVALLQVLDVPAARAQQLADTLADWIDSDAERAPLGAEDASYLGLSPPRRTAATLLSEPSELRALRGYDAALYSRLRPHVCALPVAGASAINVNALSLQQAPVLSMLSLGRLDRSQARAVLAARPARGWADALAFWSQPALAEANLPAAIYEQVQLRSRWFALDSHVTYAGAETDLHALLELDAGQVRLRGRHWSLEE